VKTSARAAAIRKILLPCVLAYPVLAIAGAVWHLPGLSLAAVLLLLSFLLMPMLVAGQPLAWAIWIGGTALMLFLGAYGLLPLVLDLVPILVNALLAWVFGRTLVHGRQSLVAHFIGTIEGPERLALPGVTHYARRLTLFWTLLLACQAAVLSFLLACAEPGGLLAMTGVATRWSVPAAWAQAYAHIGSYMTLVVAFLGEYAYRRVRLRHIPHASLHTLALQLALRWPQLLRGPGTSS
jgi:uncharacterized membrane protein